MAAHQRGIVHRDLKPENVMLVERQRNFVAKVLDFGFAKLAELERALELRPLTRVGFCFGTPQYLSPEQIRGRPIDGGADLFALGVIAYEMLAGRRPWDGPEPREVMTAVLKTLPPPVLALHPSLMPRMEEVNRFLLRVLEKERGERPHDAVAFFDELQDALCGGAAEARDVLAGARPISPIEDVTSRSIVVRPARAQRQRFDETEIDAAYAEPLPTDADDTVRELARADSASLAIVVAQRLDSQYLPPVVELHEEPARPVDSNRTTRPRGRPRRPGARWCGRRRTSRARAWWRRC